MKKISVVGLVLGSVLIVGGTFFAQTVIYKPLPNPIPGLTFTSTLPSPLVLTAGRTVSFTIKGTGLNSVLTLTMVNTRTPLWRLKGEIVSKTGEALTARVAVPKYLAPGSYSIQVLARVGGESTDTGLTAQGEELKPSAVWTEFYPPFHGFLFANSNWGRICWTLSGGRLVYDENGLICDSDWGLCGGMSLMAGERFRSGSRGTHDLSQAAAKPDAVNGQFRTLDGMTVKKFFEWMYAPDIGHATNPYHSVGYKMQQDWNGPIKQALDAHRPVVLGLIFDKKATLVSQLDPTNVADLFKQHMVLGIGYTRIGTATVRLVAYDPNYPDEILVLTFEAGKTGVSQAFDSGNPLSRRAIRGIMFIRNVS